MGFGLCNAQATFTRLMTHVSDTFIHQLMIVYFTTFVFIQSRQKHIDHIRQVLTALRKNILFISVFGLNGKLNISVVLLVGKGNVRTSPSKVATVKNWPLPIPQKPI